MIAATRRNAATERRKFGEMSRSSVVPRGKKSEKYIYLSDRMKRYGRFLNLWTDWILLPIELAIWTVRIFIRVLN